jgi:hypothetical protein
LKLGNGRPLKKTVGKPGKGQRLKARRKFKGLGKPYPKYANAGILWTKRLSVLNVTFPMSSMKHY